MINVNNCIALRLNMELLYVFDSNLVFDGQRSLFFVQYDTWVMQYSKRRIKYCIMFIVTHRSLSIVARFTIIQVIK